MLDNHNLQAYQALDSLTKQMYEYRNPNGTPGGPKIYQLTISGLRLPAQTILLCTWNPEQHEMGVTYPFAFHLGTTEHQLLTLPLSLPCFVMLFLYQSSYLHISFSCPLPDTSQCMSSFIPNVLMTYWFFHNFLLFLIPPVVSGFGR